MTLLEWRRVRKNKKIQNKKVERRPLGANFLLAWRKQLAASAQQVGGVNRRGGDEAAAKGRYHERHDEENQIKRKDGCPKPIVGLGVAGGKL